MPPALSPSDGSISIAAGIIVGLLASCIQSLGIIIQRKSHVLNQALPEHLQHVEHRRPIWLLGFLIFISSNILGSLFQIAFLPVVILAPLGAVSLLWNALFARFILGDVVSLWMVLGTLLIAGDAVLIAIFGIVLEPTHSLEDLLVLLSGWTFVAYFSLLGFAVLVCLAITRLSGYSYSVYHRNRPPSQPSSPLLIPTNSTTDLTTERTPLLDRERYAASNITVSSSATQKHAISSRTPLLLFISYASTSGILYGMCLVFAKPGVELLLISINGNNQFWQWQAWMLIFGLVVLALLQLWYLHKALRLADPTIVCPLAFCFYNVSSIVNGLVYFDQVLLLSTFQLLVTMGTFVLLGGVWAVDLQAVNVGTWSGEDDDDVPPLEGGASEDKRIPATQIMSHQHVQQGQARRPTPLPAPRQSFAALGIPAVEFTSTGVQYGNAQSSSIRSFTPIKVVGDGAFGTVWLCDWHGPLPSNTPMSAMQTVVGTRPEYANMRLVAVKRMKKRWEGGWDECRRLKEIESLLAIPPHPHIIPLYDSFLLPDSKELYFVFEPMEGHLFQLIRYRRSRPFAGGLVASIFRQIVHGLHHIHQSGYFHRDMKPENILVTTTGHHMYPNLSPVAPPHAPPERDVKVIVKLADFGLARETRSKAPYTEYVSTRWYRAPEVLLKSRDYSNPVDMWALGTIMAELVNLKPLFFGKLEADQLYKITEVLGDPCENYGFDVRGKSFGGGRWEGGVQMARDNLGFTFQKIPPKDITSLFDCSVPPRLIECIADLLKYDPATRLTTLDCIGHPYLLEASDNLRAHIPPALSTCAGDALGISEFDRRHLDV